MKVELLEESRAKVIALDGMVTLENCHSLLQQGRSLASEGFTDVIVDFELVEFIDSAGIGTLISLSRLMKDNGGSLQLRNLGDNIKRVLNMAHLDKFFEIYQSGVN
jgi:anti-sigma B factor antagonist